MLWSAIRTIGISLRQSSILAYKQSVQSLFLPTWNLCDLSQSKFKYVSYIVWCFLKCPQITDSPFKIKTCPDAAKPREARCFRFEQLIKLTIPRGHWNVRWPASIHAHVFDFDSPHKLKIPCSLPITETYICKYMQHVFVRVWRHASMGRPGSTKLETSPYPLHEMTELVAFNPREGPQTHILDETNKLMLPRSLKRCQSASFSGAGLWRNGVDVMMRR